jgi:hypothetical protein
MDDPDTPEVDGATRDHNFTLKVWKMNDRQLWDNVSFTIIEGNGTFQSLGTSVLNLNLTITQVESLDQGVELSVVPNPFHETAMLNMQFIQPVKVSAEIYSSTGQSEGWLIQNLKTNGNAEIPINRADFNLTRGVYYVKVYLDDETTNSNTTKTLRFIIL